MIGHGQSNAARFDSASANVGNAQTCGGTSRRNLKSEIRNDQGRNCQVRLPLHDCALSPLDLMRSCSLPGILTRVYQQINFRLAIGVSSPL
jgi:hypothetical protein